MSIILKGIDLPETNEIRMIAINSNGEAFFNTVKDGETSKSEKAEAIQIPTPHGRLIDRDDIYIGRWDIDSDLAEQIQNAPTILEAEGEE